MAFFHYEPEPDYRSMSKPDPSDKFWGRMIVPVLAVHILCIPAVIALLGWSLCTMFNWFAVKQFELPSMNFATGVGLIAMSWLFGWKKSDKLKPDRTEEQKLDDCLAALGRTLAVGLKAVTVVAIGVVAKQWL